jgi:hypothetical protein
MSEGLHEKVAKIHAATLQQAHYHVKTNHGISSKYNSYLNPLPFHGSGQGAADSMPRWGYLSDKIITAYQKNCINNPLLTPISKIDITTTIRAFVDDSNCVMLHIHNNKDEIVEILQINTQLWEELLPKIGGKLEIPKCKFCIITWDFDKNTEQEK